MKLLDRYMLKELMVPFAIGTFGVVLMFQANLLIGMMKQFSLSAVPLSAIFKLIIYKTPFFLSLTFPIGMALGSSLALSRLTRESELIAIRSAGASIRRIMVPVFMFGVAVAIGQFYMVELLMPPAERAANKLQAQIFILGGAPDFKSNVNLQLKNYMANFGTVMRTQDGGMQVTDAIFIEHPRAGTITVLTAEKGRYLKGRIELDNVIYWNFNGQALDDARPEGKVIIKDEVSVAEMFTNPMPYESGVEELKKEIRARKAQGQETTAAEVQYHIRYSVPFSCAVFSLAGPVFAIWLGRSGGFVGVLMSMLVVMLYYNVFVIATDILTKNGWLSPFIAAWAANALFITLAVIGLRRLE